jgi:hypothetical protein
MVWFGLGRGWVKWRFLVTLSTGISVMYSMVSILFIFIISFIIKRMNSSLDGSQTQRKLDLLYVKDIKYVNNYFMVAVEG